MGVIFRLRMFLIISAMVSFAAGCGSSDSATATTQTDPDLMEELLGPTVDPADETAPLSEPGTDSEQPEKALKATRRPRAKSGAQPLGERLELRLASGDRFPLIKTVEQVLEQKSDLAPAKAFTRLQLTMVITVGTTEVDSILMSVEYSRVMYSHDVNGQQVFYDSDSHQGSIPWDAIPYAGMIGNGFSFRLGRDNSIRELIGYREFLERCVAQVPLERRESLLSEISHRFGDDGVANFVDDSIGLLPFNSSVDPESATRVVQGDTWVRERRLMQPVPVYLTSTYRLASIDPQTAEIEITGRIAASDAMGADGISRIRVTSGQSMGHCSVDRATGLPLEMNLTRRITMKMTTPDDNEVVQEKSILTTIRSFPEMRGSVAEGRRNADRVRPVSASENESGRASPIPTTPPPGQPVRAVYPE